MYFDMTYSHELQQYESPNNVDNRNETYYRPITLKFHVDCLSDYLITRTRFTEMK